MKKLLFLLLIPLLFLINAAAQDDFSISTPEKLRPYEPQNLTISVPFDGELTIRIFDSDVEQQSIAENLPVEQGTLQLSYDGLSFNGEMLKKGDFTLEGILTSEGETLTCTATLTVSAPKEALVYVVLSSDDVYSEEDTWYIECGVTKKCNVVREIYAAENPDVCLNTAQISAESDNKCYRMSWAARAKLAPGQYIMRFYADKNPDYVIERTVTLHEGKRPSPELAAGEALFPDDFSSDEAIWEKLIQPVYIIDASQNSRAKVYERASTSSPLVGSVYGQTNVVKLLEEPEGKFAHVGVYCSYDGEYREGWILKSYLKVVQPDVHYGILIDKEKQEMHVYSEGKKIGTILVSTGHADQNSIITNSGVYLTYDRLGSFHQDGMKYDYAIRIAGSNLIHQVGYMHAHGSKSDFSKQEPLLGQAVSHGCVRMNYQITEESGGINAYWIWTHLSVRTKVMIVDSLSDTEALP